MKSFLKYIKESELETLIQPVEDYYEHTHNIESKELKLKHDKIKILETKFGKNLEKMFKDKLIFKLFNEYNWDISNNNIFDALKLKHNIILKG